MLTYHKQIDKRTTMKNQNRSAALGRPAMKLLGGGGGASTSLRSTNPRLLYLTPLNIIFCTTEKERYLLLSCILFVLKKQIPAITMAPTTKASEEAIRTEFLED